MRNVFLLVSFVASNLILCGVCYANAKPQNIASAKPIITTQSYKARVDLGGYYRNQSRSFGLADLFIPLLQSYRHLTFLDLRGITQQQNVNEFNLGAGYRYLHDDDFILGAYAFYDRRHSERGSYFNQITLGAEWRMEKFFLGANGYIPVAKQTYNYRSTTFGGPAFQSTTSFFIVTDGYDAKEVAMAGFDAQIGWHWPKRSGISTYIGGYYFAAKDVPTIAGPRGTLTLNLLPLFNQRFDILKKIEIKSMLQHDKPRGLGWMVGASLSFHLGKTKQNEFSSLASQMTDYVHRDLDIVSKSVSDNGHEFLIMADGNKAVGEYVSTKEELLAAAANSNVDVVVVDNKITLAAGTNLFLSKGQALTGDKYFYTQGGVEKSISLAQHGPSTINTAAEIDNVSVKIPTGADAVSYETQIRDVSLNTTDPDQSFVITNSIGTFESQQSKLLHSKLTVDNVTTNGSIGLIVDSTTNTTSGAISISNSKLANADSYGEHGIYLYSANNTMPVSSLNNNTIVAAGRGIEVYAGNDGVVNIAGGITNNTITIKDISNPGEFGQGIMLDASGNNASIVVFNDIDGNTIYSQAEGEGGSSNNHVGLHLVATGGGVLTARNILNNNINFSYLSDSGIRLESQLSSEITVGSISSNTIEMQNQEGIGILLDGANGLLTTDTITGNKINNVEAGIVLENSGGLLTTSTISGNEITNAVNSIINIQP